MKVIIYPQDNGLVAVMVPAPEFEDQIEAVAQKDVPEGKPWRIVDDSILPSRDVHARWIWSDEGPIALAPEPDGDAAPQT
jgi:hypothetical protein